MTKPREIIFEPHPVSPERKAELLAAGYKIIDAQFAPEGEGLAPNAGVRDRDAVMAELEARGIPFDRRSGLEKLTALLAEAEAGGNV